MGPYAPAQSGDARLPISRVWEGQTQGPKERNDNIQKLYDFPYSFLWKSFLHLKMGFYLATLFFRREDNHEIFV